MSFLENLNEEYLAVEESAPILPEGTYNAVFTDFFEETEGDYPRVVLVFTLQNNPAITFPDGSAVDGSQVQYSLFLPREEDKQKQARFGRGTEWEARIRRIKRTIRNMGGDPNVPLVTELNELKQNAVPVLATIKHRIDEETGDVYERVSQVKAM